MKAGKIARNPSKSHWKRAFGDYYPINIPLFNSMAETMETAASTRDWFSFRAPAPGISPLPKSRLTNPMLPWEAARAPEIQEEAKFRLARILEHLPKDLLPFVEYEFQEIQNGNLPNNTTSILRLSELEVVLYAPNLPKHDIRLIIAGIRHRARAVQQASEAKARENRRKDRIAADVERKTQIAIQRAAR